MFIPGQKVELNNMLSSGIISDMGFSKTTLMLNSIHKYFLSILLGLICTIIVNGTCEAQQLQSKADSNKNDIFTWFERGAQERQGIAGHELPPEISDEWIEHSLHWANSVLDMFPPLRHDHPARLMAFVRLDDILPKNGY